MQNAELETAESLSADACETYGLAFPIKKGYLSVVMSHDCRKLRRDDGVFFPILAVIFLAIFFMVLGLGVDAFFVKRAKTELQKDVDALCDSLAVFKAVSYTHLTLPTR